MAAFGTDHDLMQRLLTVETRRQSQRTLALTPIGTLLTLVITWGSAPVSTPSTHSTPLRRSPDRRDPAAFRS